MIVCPAPIVSMPGQTSSFSVAFHLSHFFANMILLLNEVYPLFTSVLFLSLAFVNVDVDRPKISESPTRWQSYRIFSLQCVGSTYLDSSLGERWPPTRRVAPGDILRVQTATASFPSTSTEHRTRVCCVILAHRRCQQAAA